MRWFAWFKSEPTAASIEWGVRRALYGDPRLRDLDASRIRISADAKGEVALSGAVSTSSAREWAVQIARKAEHVTAVRNNLRTDAQVTKKASSDARIRSAIQDAREGLGCVPRAGRVAR